MLKLHMEREQLKLYYYYYYYYVYYYPLFLTVNIGTGALVINCSLRQKNTFCRILAVPLLLLLWQYKHLDAQSKN